MRWIKCEYFYSWAERPYFMSNSFATLLSKLELDSTAGASKGSLKLTSLEWSLIRSTLCGEGKRPRRFSDALVQEEKQLIAAFLDIFRDIIKCMQSKTIMPDSNGDLHVLTQDLFNKYPDHKVKEVLMMVKEYKIAPLIVGQRVLALHPKTRELRTASLLTSDVKSYHAQFDRPELGVIIINDRQLVPISGNEYY